MSQRETQRREWRAAVARATRQWAGVTRFFRDRPGRLRWSSVIRSSCAGLPEGDPSDDELGRLDAALRAPKPWTRPAAADLGKDTRRMRLLRAESITLLRPDGTVRGVWRSKVYFAARARLRRKRRAAQRRRR